MEFLTALRAEREAKREAEREARAERLLHSNHRHSWSPLSMSVKAQYYKKELSSSSIHLECLSEYQREDIESYLDHKGIEYERDAEEKRKLHEKHRDSWNRLSESMRVYHYKKHIYASNIYLECLSEDQKTAIEAYMDENGIEYERI